MTRTAALPRTRKLTIIAQDPSVLDANGVVLTTELEIPAETLSPGPRGFRVHVIDYDSSTDTLYAPEIYDPPIDGVYVDPFAARIENGGIAELLSEPTFHAQNVYAIVMRTLARFEYALGRRVAWGFSGHQIHVAPHAFADANAFYSEHDQALVFGYFFVSDPNGNRQPIYTCLSYDVVAHETTHALLDGLRTRYTAPSSPEQAGFHEGFADIVALLSVFSLTEVVRTCIQKLRPPGDPGLEINANRIPRESITVENLKGSLLLGLAEQMGSELSGVRGNALRRSVNLKPLRKGSMPYLERTDFQEPHQCGELLVAAILSAFLLVWQERLERYLSSNDNMTHLDPGIVVEEGVEAANHLLTIAIRGLDYMPPTDIRFSDYLSAILTCDRETVPDDAKYQYRKKLRDSFASYGVKPAAKADRDGYWNYEENTYSFDHTHFESLLTDSTEVFRFIWDNRNELEIDPKNLYYGRAYVKVQSVRPCIRITPDGFTVRETVAEYVQIATLRFDELDEVGITDVDADIPDDTDITLYGGGTLVFDEFCQLKYHIRNRIFSPKYQRPRIEYLWRTGYYTNPSFTENLFSRMHLNRALSLFTYKTEGF